jgi:poly-gamma-glutamate synthesis protein (capsule biosynthesis protein)
VALAGDATITRRISNLINQDARPFLTQIREADVGLINLEVPIHNYEGYPSANSGGTYMRGPPLVADELAWAGFDMYAAASNHSGDYSHGGMEATMRELETRRIPYAGLGRNLADARSPAYFDSPAGRIGLVAACSTITPGTEAGPQGTFMQGRPGISPLNLHTTYEVPAEAFEMLESISTELGLEAIKERMHRHLRAGVERVFSRLKSFTGLDRVRARKEDKRRDTRRSLSSRAGCSVIDRKTPRQAGTDTIAKPTHLTGPSNRADAAA